MRKVIGDFDYTFDADFSELFGEIYFQGGVEEGIECYLTDNDKDITTLCENDMVNVIGDGEVIFSTEYEITVVGHSNVERTNKLRVTITVNYEAEITTVRQMNKAREAGVD